MDILFLSGFGPTVAEVATLGVRAAAVWHHFLCGGHLCLPAAIDLPTGTVRAARSPDTPLLSECNATWIRSRADRDFGWPPGAAKPVSIVACWDSALPRWGGRFRRVDNS
jgi:hypothetical protein